MKNWLCYGDDYNLEFFETRQEAIDRANEICKAWFDENDESWCKEVNSVRVAKITHVATQIKVTRPEAIDAEGFDKDGNHWLYDVKYHCDYEMKPPVDIFKKGDWVEFIKDGEFKKGQIFDFCLKENFYQVKYDIDKFGYGQYIALESELLKLFRKGHGL